MKFKDRYEIEFGNYQLYRFYIFSVCSYCYVSILLHWEQLLHPFKSVPSERSRSAVTKCPDPGLELNVV